LGIKNVDSTATFTTAADDFYRARLAHQVKGAARKAIITNHVTPKLGTKKLRDLTKRDIADCLSKLSNKARTAREALRLVRMILDHAMDRGWIDANPAATIKAASVGRASKPRTRRLTDDELKRFVRKSYGHPRGHFARFVLATGLRLKEAQLARKDWIKDGWLCLPGGIMKNGQPHRVFLSDYAKDQIEAGGEFLFAAIKAPKESIAYRTAGRVAEEVSDAAQTPGVRMHDLRRTARSYWAEMGVDPLVAEQMLAHTLPGLLATYDHANRQEPMKAAWICWGKRLKALGRDG
jgi:integrase